MVNIESSSPQQTRGKTVYAYVGMDEQKLLSVFEGKNVIKRGENLVQYVYVDVVDDDCLEPKTGSVVVEGLYSIGLKLL